MAQPNLSKLKFRIIQCSGEEADYPSSELLSQSPSSKGKLFSKQFSGWQSPKYCDYPQEMALQFLNPVRLRQIQFLSHQCKIASKIELYVFMPDPQLPVGNKDMRYKKLGYLSLDSNEQSGYQSRELKSVYIDTPCQFLKLVFHKCHLNKYNLFNQVGLIALSVFGEPLNSALQSKQAKEYFNEIQYETQYDPSTLERMRVLEEQKERAIKNEDFMEAKRIKESLEKLKQIGSQLRQLEDRKQIAIQNEDYDSANIIKKEIEKLRNAVAPEPVYRPEPVNQPAYAWEPPAHQMPEPQGYQQQQFYPQDRFNDQMQDLPPPPSKKQPSRKKQADDLQFNNQQQDNFQNYQQPVSQPNYPQYQEEEQKMEADPFNQRKNPNKLDVLLDHDEQVIPTMKGGGPKRGGVQQDEYGDDQAQNQNFKVDQLTGENLKRAEPLKDILTEDFCMKMFSKSWNAKEDALKWLDQQIGKPTQVNAGDRNNFFIAVMAAVNFTINDRVAAVYGKSISVLQTLLAKFNKLKVPKRGDFSEYTDGTIQGLMDKLGDTNARIKEEAEKAFMMMADHPALGPQLIVNALIKGFASKPKLESSIKHLNGRLFVLQELVKSHGINNPSMPYQPIVDFTVKQLEHQNEGIRTAAIFVLVEVYKTQGDRLRQALGNVRPAQMEILEKFFAEINGGGNVDSMIEEQKLVVSTHIEHQGQNNPKGKKAPANQVQAKVQSQPQKDQLDPSTVCEFCEKVSKDFRDGNKMDIHLWKECPMLTTCSQCAQVVEISSFTSHMLEECDMSKNYKKCPRCKLAIHVQNYDAHVQQMKCAPAKPLNQASRCPLCHEDIKPNAQGWRQHLVQQGCQNNERTAG